MKPCTRFCRACARTEGSEQSPAMLCQLAPFRKEPGSITSKERSKKKLIKHNLQRFIYAYWSNAWICCCNYEHYIFLDENLPKEKHLLILLELDWAKTAHLSWELVACLIHPKAHWDNTWEERREHGIQIEKTYEDERRGTWDPGCKKHPTACRYLKQLSGGVRDFFRQLLGNFCDLWLCMLRSIRTLLLNVCTFQLDFLLWITPKNKIRVHW